MLDREKLELALDIHARSYKLLRWIAAAVDDGLIEVPSIGNHGDKKSLNPLLKWFDRHFENLPPETRPDRQVLPEFVAFFTTYLTSSFDIVLEPGTRLESSSGCYCDICARFTNASHLKTKKIAKRDKRRAETLMVERVMALAAEEHRDITFGHADSCVRHALTRRWAAYSTYGAWLIKRLDGETEGRSILVLWREIAWEPSGSPMKNFSLKQCDFVAAEDQLVASMCNESFDR